MALHTFGTNATNSLTALKVNPPSVLSPADLGAFNQGLDGSGSFAVTNPLAIIATGSLHSTNVLDTLVLQAGARLGAIQVGFRIFGAGIPSGTYVAAILGPTSVQMSNAATVTGSGVFVSFLQPDPMNATALVCETGGGRLLLPGGRGVFLLSAGDVVAHDNTGWPIVVSAQSLAYGGSLWTFV